MRICAISPFRPIRGGVALNSTFLFNDIFENHDIFGVSYKKYLLSFKFAEYIHRSFEVLPKFPIHFILKYSDPTTLIKDFKIIQRIEPDLMTFHLVSPALAYQLIPFAIFAKKYKIPTLTTIHNVIPHESTMFDFPLMHFMLRFLDYFIVHCITPKKNSLLSCLEFLRKGFSSPP